MTGHPDLEFEQRSTKFDKLLIIQKSDFGIVGSLDDSLDGS